MKAHIKIPKGWRRLKREDSVKRGDLYLSEWEWQPTGKGGYVGCAIAIRKVRP